MAHKTSDVVCPNCGKCFFETTKTFTPKKTANPTMIRMKSPWAGWGWDDRDMNVGAGYGAIECPGCNHLLAPDGYLKIVKRPSVKAKK